MKFRKLINEVLNESNSDITNNLKNIKQYSDKILLELDNIKNKGTDKFFMSIKGFIELHKQNMKEMLDGIKKDWKKLNK